MLLIFVVGWTCFMLQAPWWIWMILGAVAIIKLIKSFGDI